MVGDLFFVSHQFRNVKVSNFIVMWRSISGATSQAKREICTTNFMWPMPIEIFLRFLHIVKKNPLVHV